MSDTLPDVPPAANPKSEKLNFSTKLAYGAGDLGPAVTANILVFYLLFFFTNVAGLSAGMAGSILMIGKIADAINDPIVGIMSDRTRTPWGRRLPWMLLGTIPFGFFYCLQWIVPHFSNNLTVNQWGLFAYYAAVAILFNLAYTAVNLPYTALTPELTQDYNERTSLNSLRFSFSIGGSILSLALAGLIFITYAGDARQQFFTLGLSCSLLSVFALLWCSLRIQERGSIPFLNRRRKKRLGILAIAISITAVLFAVLHFYTLLVGGSQPLNFISIFALLLSLLVLGFGLTLLSAQPEPHLIDADAQSEKSLPKNAPAVSFFKQLKIVFSNRPFLYVMGIYLCSWLAVQLTASILIYFVVNWMELPEKSFPLVAIAVQGTALILLFLWKAVSDRVGKKAVYFLGTSCWIVAQIGLFLLQPGQIGWMYALAILAGCGVSVAYLIPWSMIPDVIELDELKTGQRREGIFYAFMVLLQKFGLALALFLVGIALEAAGFVAQIPGQPVPTQPASALLAIRIAIAPLPTLALIGGLILAYFYPITKQVHEEIRLQLLERHAQQTKF
jgi:GPH family glycoside/pentoside/hexuronide:cation symporter